MSIRRASGLFLSRGAVVERSAGDVSFSAGVPSAPTLTVDVSGNLSWTAVTGSAGATLGYGVNVSPAGPTVTITGTTATVTGYAVGVTYTLFVWGVNAAGRGLPSRPQTITTTLNSANGGTTADVTNYNGTGQTWRVHTMNTSTTFTVNAGTQPFRVLLVAGGSNGGAGAGAGGRGGNVNDLLSQYLPAGALTATVGGAGTATTLGSLSSASGVLGGAGGATNGSGTNGSAGSAGIASTITGASVTYAGGGGGGGYMNTGGTGGGGGAGGAGGGGTGGYAFFNCCTQSNAQPGTAGTNNLGGGGGGGGRYDQGCCAGTTTSVGGAGGTGIIRVSYRIA